MVVGEKKNNCLGSEGVRGDFNQNPKIGHYLLKSATTRLVIKSSDQLASFTDRVPRRVAWQRFW
jgi:hypothetical protein